MKEHIHCYILVQSCKSSVKKQKNKTGIAVLLLKLISLSCLRFATLFSPIFPLSQHRASALPLQLALAVAQRVGRKTPEYQFINLQCQMDQNAWLGRTAAWKLNYNVRASLIFYTKKKTSKANKHILQEEPSLLLGILFRKKNYNHFCDDNFIIRRARYIIWILSGISSRSGLYDCTLHQGCLALTLNPSTHLDSSGWASLPFASFVSSIYNNVRDYVQLILSC